LNIDELNAMTLVDADAVGLPQPDDLVFHLQLAPFEFHDQKVIRRGMRQAVVDFLFEGLMPFFQFRKMRLHRHE
jgi:hypothetical protein